MSTGNNLLRGSALNVINLSVQVAVVFLITPLIVHSLGDRMYGIWIMLMSFVGYYALLDFGISSAVARHISKAIGQKDEEEINSVVNTAFLLFVVIGVVGGAIAGLFFLFCPFLVPNPEELPIFRALILIFGALVAISFPAKVFQGILKGFLRYDFTGYATLARVSLANLAVYYFLKSGHGILALGLITFAGSLLEYFLTIWFAYRTFPRLCLGTSLFKKETRNQLLNYSYKSFLITLTQQVRLKMDSLVIATFLDVKLITYYSIGNRFMEYFVEIVGSTIGGQLMPIFSRYEGTGDYDIIRKRFINAVNLSTMISVFFGASLLFYGKPFILRWMGEGFLSSYTILQILCVPFTVTLMQTPGVGLLYGISKHHYITYLNGFAAVMNVVFSLILVRYFSMFGVAMGTAIELLVSSVFVFPYILCRAVQIPLRHYYLKVLAWTSIKTVLPLLAYFWLVSGYIAPSYPRLILLVALQCLFFLPVAFYFILGPVERELMIKAIGRK